MSKDRRAFAHPRSPDGTIVDVLPGADSGFNARTRVHEYGGGESVVAEGAVFWSNFKCAAEGFGVARMGLNLQVHSRARQSHNKDACSGCICACTIQLPPACVLASMHWQGYQPAPAALMYKLGQHLQHEICCTSTPLPNPQV